MVLPLVLVTSLLNALIQSCDISSIEHGRLLACREGATEYGASGDCVRSEDGAGPGDKVTLVCDEGYTTYSNRVTCGTDGKLDPLPDCHKVNVRFNGLSMVKYVYPIPYDSGNGSISFSFSTFDDRSSGVLVRLASRKMMSADSLTVELIEGYLAVTLNLRSKSQNVFAYCHSDKPLNDNLVHKVAVFRGTSSLVLTVDNRDIYCDYPSEKEYIFSALRTVQVGHISPSWGSQYGFSGCMSGLSVDLVNPLLLADLVIETGEEDLVGVENVKFASTCGEEYKAVTEAPLSAQMTVTAKSLMEIAEITPPSPSIDDITKLIITSVALTLSLFLAILLWLGFKMMYHNKGTYLVDESKLCRENPEQEYFI